MKTTLRFWKYLLTAGEIFTRQAWLKIYLRWVAPFRESAVPPPADEYGQRFSPVENGNRILVLMFSRFWDQPLEETLAGAVIPEEIEITTDQGRVADAAAVVFHVPEIRSLRGIPRPPGQLWVGFSKESQIHRPFQDFWDQFDLTMTFRRDADVFSPYLPQPGELGCSLLPKIQRPLVSFFASNWLEYSGRTRYAACLMRHLPVDSFGKCLNNRQIQNDQREKTKQEIIARYKFNLAFENAIEEDYVTEKFFQPLISGTVPVYLGAPNIEDFAPGDKCFIDARTFPDPRSLAEYLGYLGENDAAYAEYHAWRNKPLRPSFLSLVENNKRHPFTVLFEKIRDLKTSRGFGSRTA